MILKIHKTLSRLTEGHSLVSFSRWDSMWPSGTRATNILSIRLYKSLQDPYINTRMLYKAAQVCDVEGYCEKTSLNRERTQSISFRSTKVQRAKDTHWSTQCIYMKTWLSDNSLPKPSGESEGYFNRKVFQRQTQKQCVLETNLFARFTGKRTRESRWFGLGCWATRFKDSFFQKIR